MYFNAVQLQTVDRATVTYILDPYELGTLGKGGKYLVFGSSRSVKTREADQKRLERSLQPET